jgi:hypothetical protein
MTEKTFLNKLANGKSDVIQLLLDKLKEQKIDYCIIGGLAVNAYTDPVASLDIDIVLAVKNSEKFLTQNKNIFQISKFPHSINLQHPDSNLRIQLQTDIRYQPFISNASIKNVLGYEMKVASLEDILKGKVWAYSDKERRKSKRQKDLADIMRLVETHQNLYNLLPEEIKTAIG